MKRRTFNTAMPALVLIASHALCISASAISVGQVDDFQSSNTDNLGWGSPNGKTTSSVAMDAGPSAGGDNALEVAYSSLAVVMNSTSTGGGQWNGDWAGEGVAEITLDVMSPTANAGDLTLWLGIQSGNGNTYVTTNSQTVTSDGAWHAVAFDVTESGWTDFSSSITAALQDVVQLRIIHNPSQSFIGGSGVSSLFVDNITAVGVPEPSSAGLLGLLLAAAGVRTRSSRRSRDITATRG